MELGVILKVRAFTMHFLQLRKVVEHRTSRLVLAVHQRLQPLPIAGTQKEENIGRHQLQMLYHQKLLHPQRQSYHHLDHEDTTSSLSSRTKIHPSKSKQYLIWRNGYLPSRSYRLKPSIYISLQPSDPLLERLACGIL
jgi:hypothetical protein